MRSGHSRQELVMGTPTPTLIPPLSSTIIPRARCPASTVFCRPRREVRPAPTPPSPSLRRPPLKPSTRCLGAAVVQQQHSRPPHRRLRAASVCRHLGRRSRARLLPPQQDPRPPPPAATSAFGKTRSLSACQWATGQKRQRRRRSILRATLVASAFGKTLSSSPCMPTAPATARRRRARRWCCSRGSGAAQHCRRLPLAASASGRIRSSLRWLLMRRTRRRRHMSSRRLLPPASRQPLWLLRPAVSASVKTLSSSPWALALASPPPAALAPASAACCPASAR